MGKESYRKVNTQHTTRENKTMTQSHMYQDIIWAMITNGKGIETDLAGDYKAELDRLDSLTPHENQNDNEWGLLEAFYLSLKVLGHEKAHVIHEDIVSEYPCLTRFLTICVCA